MPFQKVQKNKAYFKRYQTQFRRRREGKTDYFARRRLVTQDKNKYNAPKYRLVVRFTNKDIICQIVYSKVVGDFILSCAYAHELPRYGITLGLTNYAAAYATGLLLARRTLQKLKLDKVYKGVSEVLGEDYNVPTVQGPRPFKALLDVGLQRTTTGSKVFAAMKGVCDGGINVPHSERRFVGATAEEFDAETLRKYIFGGHVGDYMNYLLENDPAKYDIQFSRYKKAGITADKLEEMYEEAHEKIRADPSFVKKEKKEVEKKRFSKKRLTYAERKAALAAKKRKYGYPEGM